MSKITKQLTINRTVELLKPYASQYSNPAKHHFLFVGSGNTLLHYYPGTGTALRQHGLTIERLQFDTPMHFIIYAKENNFLISPAE